MNRERTPSATRFVAHFEGHEKVGEPGGEIPDCEERRPLEHDQSVQLIRVAAAKDAPRSVWAKVQAALPDATVAPVLIDAHGNQLYPTGVIQIRFVEPPSDEQLEALAREHRLRHLVRNRYQPRQVSCRPDDPTGRYLPDVVEEVGKWPGTKAVWAETKARYERT